MQRFNTRTTKAGPHQIAVQRYLQRDPLKHILHLKMIAYHGHLIEMIHIVDGSLEGVLLLLPSTASSYDHQNYGNYDLVAMPVADSPEILSQLLDQVPKAAIVFKLIQDSDEAVIQKRFAGMRVRVFLNYTSADAAEFSPAPDVVINTQLNDKLIEVFGRNGYTPDEVIHYLEDGGKTLSIQENGRPVSIGLIYPNFDHIWEIAALYTEPSARRKGYSIRIVRTALYLLKQDGFTPRYVVDEVNTPSTKLVQAVGLTHFLNVIHYTVSHHPSA